ncbi:MAG TPA: glycine zipper 2TM domain-containing protein [Noviherbaspirillum sp.]|uniref:glycine zipper 2TM domain-containing protein n=1 Tax=Noviherbaspirillum sp. TaxID=1926288 RepID=UPI002D74B2DF|nr:glycine zipper 2TM domain-containing protein [Noviherbaspirillum sp.]HYD97087.1 glycine zipper 2TM domain-containing protein [Noviherbaspirillum sp.]
MENNTTNRIHPLVAGAAISVMLVSLTGVAAITGLIPNSHSSAAAPATPVAATAGPTVAAASPAALVEPKQQAKADDDAPAPVRQAPAEKRATARPATESSHAQPRRSYAEPAPRVAQAPAICHSCGRVESIQAIEQVAQPSGVGMVAGAVLGGVLGNQVGGGNGRKIATVAGAVGGGYAGNEIEKRSRATTSYKVRVRMEDGDIRTFPYAQQPAWNVGDRVRVVDGQLTSRA